MFVLGIGASFIGFLSTPDKAIRPSKARDFVKFKPL
jgi:hypothetical protein